MSIVGAVPLSVSEPDPALASAYPEAANVSPSAATGALTVTVPPTVPKAATLAVPVVGQVV